MNEEKELLNQKQAAEYLGICRWTFWRLSKLGKIKAEKTLGQHRYSKETLDILLEKAVKER